ncbi:MAG: hypothetical protein PVG53_03980 [Holophagae bacterium]|jgi:hypothetical protein
MNLAEYGQAVVSGVRSILDATTSWRDNPLTEPVNRRLWGRWWPATLAALVGATVAVDAVLPPIGRLAELAPPLQFAIFFPGLIRDLLYSAPALFGFVVVWRLRRLRASEPTDWPPRSTVPDFGLRFFQAAALPVAAAALAIGFGVTVVSFVVAAAPPGTDAATPGIEELGHLSASGGAATLARSVLVIALITGLLVVHRRLGAGFGKLIGAGFFVWGIHIGIGFAVPWMTSWLAWLPVIGQYAPQRSTTWAHLLFDLAVACAAWTAAAEKVRPAPLWADAPPPPPPSTEASGG